MERPSPHGGHVTKRAAGASRKGYAPIRSARRLLHVAIRVCLGVDQVAVPTLEGRERGLIEIRIALGEASHLRAGEAAEIVALEVAKGERLGRGPGHREILLEPELYP